MTRTSADQEALEKEMISLGCDRVNLITNKQQRNRMESLSKWGEALTVHGIDQIVIHLRAVRKRIEQGKAGKAFALLSPITHLPPPQVAAAAVRTVIDSISSNQTLHSVAIEIAEKLWIETMLDRATQRELFSYRRGRSRKSHRVASIRRMSNTEMWSPKERMASGVFLIELIARETGMIEIVLEGGKPPRRIVQPTEQCMEWIENVKKEQRLMTPTWLPMLVQPRPWDSPLSGGYLDPKLPLKLFKSNAEIIDKHCDGSEPFMMAANVHQAVAWRVDNWMLEQVTHAYETNLEIGCLLPREGWPVPPYPKHLEEDHPDVLKWRKRARYICEKNEKTRTARIHQAKTLWVARRFKEEEELYFPMSLDFRGRLYYRPPYLNPQGNDVSRCLLQFTNGTPISTEEEADWLRVHGANLYGLGKTDWRTRIDWVHEHRQFIRMVGSDPWQHVEFWMRADKPWSFLAFCRSYYEYTEQGHGYICHLPIMLDCTCSGIQHYASLLRSEEMGELVNLKENDQPQDIYNTVINRVNVVLRDSDDPRADKWLLLQPDRSLAKSGVMTLPYSATPMAFYHYCYEWAIDRAKLLFNGNAWTTQPGAMTTMHFMAKILHQQSSELIGPAVRAMEWFKKVGRIAAKKNVPLKWTTPSGLLVHQEYPSMKDTRIRLKYLSDVHLDIRAKTEDTTLDSRRMGCGLSPNIVHSFDASHMSFATIHAISSGVLNLGGVHDCFVTTPAEMSQLRDSVRQSFAEQYSTDWLTPLTTGLLHQIPTDSERTLPPKPELGKLDPSTVRTSNYFIT